MTLQQRSKLHHAKFLMTSHCVIYSAEQENAIIMFNFFSLMQKLRLIAKTSDRVGCDFSDKGIVNALSLRLRFAVKFGFMLRGG